MHSADAPSPVPDYLQQDVCDTSCAAAANWCPQLSAEIETLSH